MASTSPSRYGWWTWWGRRARPPLTRSRGLRRPHRWWTISAPTPTLTFGAGELLLLQAKAQLVACNGTDKGQVAFNWSCTDSSSGAVLPLPGASSSRLGARAAWRAHRCWLAARTCYASSAACRAARTCAARPRSASRCATARWWLASPAATVPSAWTMDLQLDASASGDPDEPTSALSYNFSCSPVDTGSLCPPLPNASLAEPVLTLLPSELPAGTFDFSVSVSKADGEVATSPRDNQLRRR